MAQQGGSSCAFDHRRARDQEVGHLWLPRLTITRRGRSWAYHCCRADTPATLEAARFVRSLAGMFAARPKGYAAMLEDPGIKDALGRADTDPASAFEMNIRSTLTRCRVLAPQIAAKPRVLGRLIPIDVWHSLWNCVAKIYVRDHALRPMPRDQSIGVRSTGQRDKACQHRYFVN